jgi:hypothetical protein
MVVVAGDTTWNIACEARCWSVIKHPHDHARLLYKAATWNGWAGGSQYDFMVRWVAIC